MENIFNIARRAALLAGVLICWAGTAAAAPGDILFFDDFDNGAGCSNLNGTWVRSSNLLSGSGTQTSNSGNCSLFTRGGEVSVRTGNINLSGVAGARLNVWIRQGADSFSEDVDAAEDLAIEYRVSGNQWIALRLFFGSGPNGEITNVSAQLPATALISNFRLRFRQTGGSGGPPANGGIGWDYWHIDDVTITETVAVPTGGLGPGGCDNFENGFGNWSTTIPARSGINSQTANSPSNSLYLQGATVATTSIPFDTSNAEEMSVWVRRGADSFSENPDNGENLFLEYRNASNTWVSLEVFPGGGTPGEILNRTYTLPAAALHPDFQIRFRLIGASGANFDYWHIDDVCVTAAPPVLVVEKGVRTEWDPINNFTNPYNLPGSWSVYSITVRNTGNGVVDAGTLSLGEVIAPDTTLFTGDFDGAGSPFRFIDGTGADISGLSLDWAGLGAPSDGVVFRNAGGASITPNGGFDGAVERFELTFSGAMNSAASGGAPSFTIEYRVLVD